MEYIVAVGFDYFDGDFAFVDGVASPLLEELEDDSLSWKQLKAFDSYESALAFAKRLVDDICDRAKTDTDESKELYIQRVRGLSQTMETIQKSSASVTFDLLEDYGNWEISVAILERLPGRVGCQPPDLW